MGINRVHVVLVAVFFIWGSALAIYFWQPNNESEDRFEVLAGEVCINPEKIVSERLTPDGEPSFVTRITPVECGPVYANVTTGNIYYLNYSTSPDFQVNATAIEDLVVNFTNQIRNETGIGALEQHSMLQSIAYNHSRDMSERGFYDHVNPDGLDPTARGEVIDYVCTKGFEEEQREGLGENIHKTYVHDYEYLQFANGKFYVWLSDEEIAFRLVQDWYDSPAHRVNLLDPVYDRIGVGVYLDWNDVYATQNFC